MGKSKREKGVGTSRREEDEGGGTWRRRRRSGERKTKGEGLSKEGGDGDEKGALGLAAGDEVEELVGVVAGLGEEDDNVGAEGVGVAGERKEEEEPA